MKPDELGHGAGGDDVRWLDRMPRDDIVGEQVLEPPPPHRDAVECGRGTRGSNAPEHRRKCNVASQDGTRNSECALRNLATRMPQADWLSRKGMKQGTPGNYKRCHWRGAARLVRRDTDVSHATRVQNGWGKGLVPARCPNPQSARHPRQCDLHPQWSRE